MELKKYLEEINIRAHITKEVRIKRKPASVKVDRFTQEVFHALYKADGTTRFVDWNRLHTMCVKLWIIPEGSVELDKVKKSMEELQKIGLIEIRGDHNEYKICQINDYET